MNKKQKEKLIRQQLKLIKEHHKKLRLWDKLLNKKPFEKLLKEEDNPRLDEIMALISEEKNKVREDIRDFIKYLNTLKSA